MRRFGLTFFMIKWLLAAGCILLATCSVASADMRSPEHLVHARPRQKDIGGPSAQREREGESGDNIAGDVGKQPHFMRSEAKKKRNIHPRFTRAGRGPHGVLAREGPPPSGTALMTAAGEILSRGVPLSLDGPLVDNNTWSVESSGSVAQKDSLHQGDDGARRHPEPSLDSSPGLHCPAGSNCVSRLNLCQGDCDSDSDCSDGHKCFRRGGTEAVPGCAGDGKEDWDYCFDATPDSKGGWSAEEKPLWKCEGDCDTNADCKGNLTCFQRSGNEDIPGCNKGGESGFDYCIGDVSPGSI